MAKRVGKKGKLPGLPARSPSIESTSSQGTSPVPRLGKKASDIDSQGAPQTYGRHLFDCCCSVVYCSRHNNFALCKIGKNKGLFLPYVALRPIEGWYAAMISRLKIVLSVAPGPKNYLTFAPPDLIHILRLQIPNIYKYMYRMVYFTQLTYDEKHPVTCCQTNKTVTWVSAGDMANSVLFAELWGPEPQQFADAFLQQTLDRGAYHEFTLRDAMRYAPRDPPKTFQDELVKAASFTEKDIFTIYAEYLQHCYPSQYMVFSSFTDYLMRIGWTMSEFDGVALYRAFAFNGKNFLTFHEFLLGFAASEKQTTHGGHPGELRCGYIFRYYDTNNDGFLDHSEMVKLTLDILKLKSKPFDEESVEKEIEKNYASLQIAANEPVTLQLLLRGVGTMAFRGSSALFRSTYPILQLISLKRCYDSVSQLQSSTNVDMDMATRARTICPRCKSKKFSLAIHCVKVASDATIVEAQDMGLDEMTTLSKDRRAISKQIWSGESLASRMLDWIRDFVYASNLVPKGFRQRGRKGSTNHWISADRGQLSNAVLRLCQDAEQIFRREPRCLRLGSPCYVLGDIHGNLHDLITYEKILWEKGPSCSSTSFLFLGDYVDRGEFGLEVVMYLISCKIINPDKYFMLRGNHELRPIQTVFTFQKECYEKFGKNYGPYIWEACNKIFDCLPLCSVVDDAVFCAHGGIPTSAVKLEELAAIPVPLHDPENQSPAAWEMLWNDPISGNEFGEYAEMLRLQSGSTAFNSLQGFLPNTRRGTAYYFSDEAVSKFLTSNGLSHIIRAHEVIPPGYQFHMGGRVITVFSSSRYCGGANEAASIFVEQEKLRVMRLDTTS